MKVIADTNIIISALISPKGKESDIILNPVYDFKKYTCNFLYDEILRHKAKILKAAGLKNADFFEVYFHISSRVRFINEEQIPDAVWKEALAFTTGIDESDTPFVALTLYLDGFLWTGDKKLIGGLAARGFKNILTTADLIKGKL
jgi:predicted nucleic acid-binding protein